MIKKLLSVCAISALCAGVFSSCTEKKSETAIDGKLSLVTTTTYTADLARVIAGDKVNVTNLCGPGVDPHTYVATVGDVAAIEKADVLVYIGFGLEAQLDKILTGMKKRGANVICSADSVRAHKVIAVDEDGEMVKDPHIWNDVTIWSDVAAGFAAKMCEYDPVNAASYKANLAAYQKELVELDIYVKARMQEIPVGSRVLITAHDAFSYMAKAYGIEVDALQGLSTATEAGTKDVMKLTEKILAKRIKAIFVENIANPDTMQSLIQAVQAKGGDVKMGGELYSDALGDEASGRDTYIKVIKGNAQLIVEALK